MKTGQALLLTALVLSSSAAAAGGQCKGGAIEPLANRLAERFATKRLASLDPERPYRGSIQFVVEHAITDEHEVEEKPSLAAIEKWLMRHEPEGFSAREARPLSWCKKGLCVFDLPAGIEHNHRYVQKLTYGYDKGCPYIRSVFLLDGD